jgi:hypothetical protein
MRLGEEITVAVQVYDSNGTPQLPDDCPIAKIFNAAGSVVWTAKIAIQDRYGTVGYFQQNIFLGPAFAVGPYTVTYSYAVGGNPGSDEDNFEVIAGGDSDGTTESLYFYHRPQADYVIQQLSSGKIKRRRNPRPT